MASAQRELLPAPTDAISCVSFHPQSPSHLLVASWDRYLYHYDISAPEGSQLVSKVEHRAPILSCAWSPSQPPGIAYSVGLDYDVRTVNLTTSEQIVLSSHDAPAAHVVKHAPTMTLVSGSWDCTLHVHHPDPNDPTSPSKTNLAIVQLPAKPFAMALSPTNLIVAMSTRVIHIYAMSALSTLSSQAPSDSPTTLEPLQRRESALKFMTRAVSAMPSDLGFACSSIEGRVAVEWFDPSEEAQKKKYAFKCHRVKTQQQNPQSGVNEDVDVVYPVHALAFHPVHGTFASGGGDGTVSLWDAAAKRRIKQYQPLEQSVCAMEFNCDGKSLAVAVSPAFESGDEGEGLREGDIKVLIRDIPAKDIVARTGK